MSHDLEELDESVCDGLLVDSEGWAFGGSFEDPLAGVDLTVPDGVDPVALARTCLALGDDALVLGHRLSEWCSRAPDLEEDVALANMALDLLGQARLLLTRAAAADPSVVPALPEGSPAPAEDALAYFRDAQDFRCHRLVEVADQLSRPRPGPRPARTAPGRRPGRGRSALGARSRRAAP